MSIDWKVLTPHRPLDPRAQEYVLPPSQTAQSIVGRVLAGGTTVLVGGPVGVGKSTELAKAAELLQDGRVACLVPVDRWENMRRISPERLLLRIAGRLAHVAILLGLAVSEGLRTHLVVEGVLPQEYGGKASVRLAATASSVLRSALAEVARLSRQGRIALLVDGLEKVPPGVGATELFDALSGISDELTDLVVVIPWHAAFGAAPEGIVRAGERLEMVRPPEVEGEAGEAGRVFLLEILERRLSAPLTDRKNFEFLARNSGGLPRTFLQLAADAGTYARIRRNESWPQERDTVDAIADQRDSFRRALLPGDTEAILRILGTDGRELELERKVRLMAHGLLIERIRGHGPVLEAHPLVRDALELGGARA